MSTYILQLQNWYIEIQPSEDVHTLESRIERVGETLPYDKGRIVDNED